MKRLAPLFQNKQEVPVFLLYSLGEGRETGGGSFLVLRVVSGEL